MHSKSHPWLHVLRLWSITASTIPVVAGAVVAARHGRFAWSMLGLTLVSGWLLQLAVNLLNTYGDYRSGVDTAETPPNAPQLVDGSLRPGAVLAAGCGCLALGAGLGALAAARSDWRLLYFGVAGVLSAAVYTTGPCLKYRGLGLPLVGISMGMLMVMASQFAQSGVVTAAGMAAALPIACLTVAILHGNDLRDRASDLRARILTATLLLGEGRARALFHALHLAPYLLVGAAAACGILPLGALGVLLALPLSAGAIRTCQTGFQNQDHVAVARLEGLSARAHFTFGVLLIVGLLLGG